MPSDATLWETWVTAQIARRIETSEGNLIAAVGEIIGEEKNAANAAITELRRENERADELIEQLQHRVDELERRLMGGGKAALAVVG